MPSVPMVDVAGDSRGEKALSEIAEVCIEEALKIAREQLAAGGTEAPEAAEQGDFLVVGMGKLASEELTYGSDLDLIFLYKRGEDASDGEATVQDYFVRSADFLRNAEE